MLGRMLDALCAARRRRALRRAAERIDPHTRRDIGLGDLRPARRPLPECLPIWR